MKTRITKLAAAALAGAGLLFGSAQAAPELLPRETVFALGINDASTAMDYLEPFVDKWQELGLNAFDLNGDDELPPELEDLDLLELLGESAWIGVAASASSPIPDGFGLFRVSGDVRAFVEEALQEAATEEDTLTLTEGDHTFYLLEIEEDATDGMVEGVAVALTADGLLAFTSGSDSMRGVLRRAGGSDEPSFVDSPSYLAVSALADDTFFSFLDLARIGSVAANFGRPFVGELGLSGLIDDLESAFAAAGILAAGTEFAADGVHSHGIQLVGDSDSPVRELLLERGTVTGDLAGGAPSDTLSYSHSWVDAAGWWDWLNGLAQSVPELGGDLNLLVESMIGVNPEEGIFSWLGNEVRTVMTDYPDSADIGVASDNMLGSLVYILDTADADTAKASIDNVFFMGSMLAQSMMSLDGTDAPAEPELSEVAGVEVTTYDFSDGFSLSYAIADGHVYFTTDTAALAAVLEGAGGSDLERLAGEVPADVTSYGVTDYSESLRATGEQLAAQLGLFAGLSGEDLDFEQLEEFSAGLTEFFNFVADRTGDSWTYTTVDGDTIVTEGFVEVDW